MLNSMNFETEMLEAHDWNEEECKKTLTILSDYFNKTNKFDPDLAKADLGIIFSQNICDVIFNYMDFILFEVIKARGGSGEA
jgi:hypothetical protein